MVGRLIMCFAFGACGLFAPGCDGGRPMSPVAPDDEVLTFDAAMLARDAGPASPDATRPGPRAVKRGGASCCGGAHTAADHGEAMPRESRALSRTAGVAIPTTASMRREGT